MSPPLFKVVITDVIKDALAPEREILGDVARVEALGAASEDELAGRFEDADGVIVYNRIKFTRCSVAALTRCRVIVRAGVGYDNIDHPFARERGIPVAHVPDYGTEDVADSAIGLMLALTRGIALMNSRLRAGPGPWNQSSAAPLERLRGRVLGIVGLGRIGTATVLRAKPLGLEIAYYDPYKPRGYDKALGLRRVDALEELLAQSHILSLHCPLTSETRHLIGAAALGRMPRGSYLVNTARGAVVDTAAIPDAIASGQLAGAGIDVLEREPPPDDHPLIRAWRDPAHPAHERVIITPHVAFYSEQGLTEMRTKAARACRAGLLGLEIPNLVVA